MVAIRVRIFERAAIIAFTLFVRASVDAFTDIPEFGFESLLGNPSIANTVFVDVRIAERAALIQTVTKIVRTVVFLVGHTVAIAVLSQEESAPSDTAVDLVLRSNSRPVFQHAGIVFHRMHLRVVGNIRATQEIRTTEVDIETNREVEHDSTGQVLHVELDIVCVFIQLENHVVFRKQREEVHEVNFKGTRCVRIREEVLVCRVDVTTVTMDNERNSVNLVEVEGQSTADLGNSAADAISLSRKRFRIFSIPVDEFRFANPETILRSIHRTEVSFGKDGDVHRLLVGERKTDLQVGLDIANVANTTAHARNGAMLAKVSLTRFRINLLHHGTRRIGRACSIVHGKLVVVNRNADTDIEVVPKADTKTHLGTQSYVIFDHASAKNRTRKNAFISSIVSFGDTFRSDVFDIRRRIQQSIERQFRMSQGLGGLSLINTNKTSLVDGLWVVCKSLDGQSKRKPCYYSLHRDSLINRVFSLN